ncbi:hypothetical protein M436DRAFT_56729 [Aureobasidium namibiae CBS 147.97]|uniref:Uncharacterized protein n=1 Tax=Aureobasidium namibiae CBS 147.97 TaxID=1043004 RepID=A0A074W8D6_9PEZI|nr:uncharacterized protein M436DRAFT_56729 [Aureobasidium namibiae CBS 147.97]KEQ69118.1 hypothetical protein M436DRAFT_56729 [Aureobasidium namibiae CBS 147.97]
MTELKVHVLIQARYRIFDATGEHPFTIDIGLCRRSPDDTDPRSLIIDVSGSALDVPYALANELLISHGVNTLQRDKERLKHMNLCSAVEEGNRYITLPSPVGRTRHYKDCFTVFEHPVDKGSELASLFLPGKEYCINLASEDLGIKWYTYLDDPSVPIDEDLLSRPSETAKIVNSRPSAGHAGFRVVESLPWPPEVSTRLHLVQATETAPACLQISITNMSTQSLSIEPRGRPQLYLQPRDLLGDRTTTRPHLHRTLTPDLPLSSFGFSITNATTREEIADNLPRPGCMGLTRGNLDPRPSAKNLLTLEPGQAILRYVDIGTVLCKYGDGVFTIRLREQCKWWCVGNLEDICEEEEGSFGRVKRELFCRDIPPLVLNSDDTVKVKKVEGEIVRN